MIDRAVEAPILSCWNIYTVSRMSCLQDIEEFDHDVTILSVLPLVGQSFNRIHKGSQNLEKAAGSE